VCPSEREIDVWAQIQRLRERRRKLKEELFGCIEHTQRKIRDARVAALAIDYGEAAAQAGASSAANQEGASASTAPPQPTPSTSSQGAVAAQQTGAIPKARANWVPTEVDHLRAKGSFLVGSTSQQCVQILQHQQAVVEPCQQTPTTIQQLPVTINCCQPHSVGCI